MNKTLLLALALVALPLSGCVENMSALKDKVTGGDEPVAPATETPPAGETPGPAVDNATIGPKAPVARMKVFAENGALLFASSFIADDGAAPVIADAKSKLTVNAGESAALEPGATIPTFEWVFGDQKASGRQATIEMFEDPGTRVLTLTITDSNGKLDSQNVTLAIMPQPFDVVTKLTTDAMVGGRPNGQAVGDPATLTFDVVHEIDGKMVTAKTMSVVAAPPAACDVVFELLSPDGSSLGAKDGGSVGETESFNVEPPVVGTYTAKVTPFACAAPDGVPVTITITYIEVVEGLGDGHGHAGH